MNHIIKIEDKYQLQTYSKFPIVITKGKGMYVYDSEGNKYLDLYGGHAVALTGHCHPKIVDAIKTQSEKLIFYSNAVYNETRAKLSKLLIEVSGMDKVFFCNSGSEANENAIKLARKVTNKEEIISMKESFHGRTLGSLSITGIEKYNSQFKTLPGNVKFVEFGSIESVKQLINDNTAAIILEPIQSIAGVKTANKKYFLKLKKLCKQNNIVLIFDEVQTFARTGKMFFGQNYGIKPDIITTAKGIASGFPMGAVLIYQEITYTVKKEEYGSTFGGSPLGCAASLATLNTILNEKLCENSNLIFDYLKSKLPESIKLIGMGCLIGLKFDQKVKPIQEKLLKKGVIVGTSMDPCIIRLLPPLIIKKEHIDEFIEKLNQVL